LLVGEGVSVAAPFIAGVATLQLAARRQNTRWVAHCNADWPNVRVGRGDAWLSGIGNNTGIIKLLR